MRSFNVRVFGLLGVFALAGFQACDDDDDPISPTPPRATRFTASLNTANENVTIGSTRPATGATGSATFNVVDDTTMTFTVTGNNITGVRVGHIHMGTSGVNGSVIVDLINNATPTGLVNGELANGTFRQSNIKAIFEGKPAISMDSLRTLMQVGAVYANIHTSAFAGGEIRGQIVPAP